MEESTREAQEPHGDPRSQHKRRRLLFDLVYCLPTGYVLVHWRGYEYPLREALLLSAVSLGGLSLVVVLCTALLPLVLRHLAGPETAYPWQRAAFDALGYVVVFPLGWAGASPAPSPSSS